MDDPMALAETTHTMRILDAYIFMRKALLFLEPPPMTEVAVESPYFPFFHGFTLALVGPISQWPSIHFPCNGPTQSLR